MLCVAPPVCVPPGGEPGHRPVRRAEPVARPGEPPGSGRQREFLNIPERPGPGGQSAGSCQDNTRTGRGGDRSSVTGRNCRAMVRRITDNIVDSRGGRGVGLPGSTSTRTLQNSDGQISDTEQLPNTAEHIFQNSFYIL